MTTLLERASALADDLVALRRDLHRNPELSFREERTAEVAAAQVEPLGFEVRRGVGRTGVVAELRNGDGAVVALRADMDALPIHELNEVEYRSCVEGVMHACGHDAHVSMLVGAARLLADARTRGELPSGTVRLLFQPSEETADEENLSGAARMVEDGAMDGVHAVFGLHIGAHLDAGLAYIGAGPVMAGSDSFTATIEGRSSHAARPNEGVDAIVLASHVVLACQSAVSRRISPLDQGVLTIGRMRGGVAENVVAERVTLEGTIRYFDADVRRVLRRELERALGVADALGGAHALDYREGYPPVVNDEGMTELARAAATAALGEEAVTGAATTMGAEDFAILQRSAPGCFIWIGGGLDPKREHHHPHFDIDEGALPRGAAILAACAVRSLETLGA